VDASGKKLSVASMSEWLDALALTPATALRHVQAAHEKASVKAHELGIAAPSLDANAYDCLWAMAMCLSDYWVSVGPDLEAAAMFAYQYLSDPDKAH